MKIATYTQILACAAMIGAAAPIHAQDMSEVSIKSNDGQIDVAGQLLRIEDGHYVVQTAMGLTRVPVAGTYCKGACDQPTEAAAIAQKAEAKPAAAPPATAEAGGVRFGIHGSRTIGTHLIPNLLKGYAAKIGAEYRMQDDNPKERVVTLVAADGSVLATIDLQTKGSGSAFPALATGVADIGMADRRMKDDDLSKLTEGSLTDLRDTADEVILGLDGIIVLVHPSNPLQNITFEELSRIYSGEVTNWKDVGGPDLAITLHSFPDGSGDRSIFLSRALDPFGKTEMETAIEHEEYAEVPAAVLADPGAIGFLGRAFKGDEAKVLPIRESCGLVSPPTNFRMKTEGYAMSRRIYLYRDPTGVEPLAQELIDFAFSPEGQKIIVESGFVDRQLEGQAFADMSVELNHAKAEPDFQPETFDMLLRELGGAERLSVALRFGFSKATLDPLSMRAVDEVAEKLKSGAYDGREVLVVGFADSVGSFAQNERLALRRAETVRAELADRIGEEAAQRLKLTVQSYGELLPYLCNEDEVGRDANRRVEIWLR